MTTSPVSSRCGRCGGDLWDAGDRIRRCEHCHHEHRHQDPPPVSGAATIRGEDHASCYDDAEPEPADTAYGVDHAADAYHAIRSLNHTAIGPIPAPVAYELLGSLQAAVHALPQALDQIRRGLSASLTCYDLFEDSGAYPAEAISDAARRLSTAARQLQAAGRVLERAQQSLAGVSYRIRHDAADHPRGDHR